MRDLMIFLFLTGLALDARAGGADVHPKGTVETVRGVIAKYKTKTPVKVKLRKRVKSTFSVKEKVSEGILFLGAEKLRLNITKPEKSVLALNGDTIWIEDRIVGRDGKEIVQVSKMQTSGQRRANALLALLFEDRNIFDDFKLVTTTNWEGVQTYSFVPVNNGLDLTSFEISIYSDGKRLSSLSYEDSRENKITYDFGQTEFKANVNKDVFNYKPPKGVKPEEF